MASQSQCHDSERLVHARIGKASIGSENCVTERRMRAETKKFLRLLLCSALSTILASTAVFADDDAKTRTPTSTDARKLDAPKPGLTERERWLLDRVEQLEKRVAELESKSLPAASSTPSTALPSAATTPETVAIPAAAGGPNAAPAAAATTTSPSTAVKPPSEQTVGAGAKPEKAAPFAFADFTWLNGNPRTKTVPLDTPFFTPEIRADVDYIYDFHHPKDDTISGSSEVFRTNEVQVTQFGVGGDFHFDNVRARIMTQFGMYSQTTPRNDSSYSRGQWNLDGAYRYLSEAYGG